MGKHKSNDDLHCLAKLISVYYQHETLALIFVEDKKSDLRHCNGFINIFMFEIYIS
jgi:hypothetical protein